MPHPKNHMKLTGDTHLPDLDDLAGDEALGEPLASEESPPRVYADGYAPQGQGQSQSQSQSRPQGAADLQGEDSGFDTGGVQAKAMGHLAATRPTPPWLVAGAAIGLAWMVGKLLTPRRD